MSKSSDITLTSSQKTVLDQMKEFVFHSEDRIFILKGYAGTGKTTLMKFFIKELDKEQKFYKLLSTTGRAAKILANYTGSATSTIHSMIYKFKDFNKDVSDYDPKSASVDSTGQLYLVFEPACLSGEDRHEMVYIIDEASMVSDTPEKDIVQAQFGSGRVLKELLEYDDLKDSKFVFIGDPCQLPPILGTISPALTPDYFYSKYRFKVQEGTLTEIMRQDNSIIAAGEYLRNLWEQAPEDESCYFRNTWGAALDISRYKDVHVLSDQSDMERQYLQIIKTKGYNESVFICNSNSKASQVSERIRNALGFGEIVQKGDLLMVIQNQSTTGLMNGDMVEVQNIRPESERTMKDVLTPEGYHTSLLFREITVKELFTKRVYTTLLLETTLQSKQVNLDSRQQSGLFLDFILRMRRKGIDNKKNQAEFEKAMRADPYLNALRCNYGYAITCHKAQGGEWNSVFIQVPRNITFNPVKNKYQWLYTAVTRARQSVYVSKDFFIK